MAYLHGKFVWFEHVSNDIPAARGFYEGLFGWKSEGMDMGGQTYHMIQNGADGIGGFRQAPPGAPNHWMGYLSVADVDATAASAAAAGAKVMMPPTDFAPVGRGATLADPTGGVFSIWKDSQQDRPDAAVPVPGDWCWMELMSNDAAKALAFYERVFGFTHQDMDMGPPNGVYHILLKDGVQRCGLMKNPVPEAPSSWMPYVAVVDCDASAEKARELGANLCVPATDIPGIGRFAAIADPNGAMIGLFRGQKPA
jgi:hypothetical protein